MQEAEQAADLREQAAMCRRLADAVIGEADSAALRNMADQYETEAAKLDGEPTMNGMQQLPPQA